MPNVSPSLTEPSLAAREAPNPTLRAQLLAVLLRAGLAIPGELADIQPLTGGVSSDILRVVTSRGIYCVKRALPKLRVQADWRAPTERNRYEVEWMRLAGSILPGAVPRVLADDRDALLFVMEYLEPETHPVWKTRLREGVVEPDFAGEVGRRIARIHSATADDPEVARRFATDGIFFPIRLEPYLTATARAHPDVGPQLEALVRVTGTTKHCLVHGDVSPKNILCGPGGPVFLDAECAWFGDPAFDLAFCLNHMLLKCLWRPSAREGYLSCFSALARAYLEGVTWENPRALEARTARLLPGLFLARVDGKSPVEYVTEAWQREQVRHLAKRLLLRPARELDAVSALWREELEEEARAHPARPDESLPTERPG